jgi:hypothetical protein
VNHLKTRNGWLFALLPVAVAGTVVIGVGREMWGYAITFALADANPGMPRGEQSSRGIPESLLVLLGPRSTRATAQLAAILAQSRSAPTGRQSVGGRERYRSARPRPAQER